MVLVHGRGLADVLEDLLDVPASAARHKDTPDGQRQQHKDCSETAALAAGITLLTVTHLVNPRLIISLSAGGSQPEPCLPALKRSRHQNTHPDLDRTLNVLGKGAFRAMGS